MFIAEEYVHAFNKLARTNNTLILPSNVGDVTSLVGHAMSIYNAVSKQNNTKENNSGIESHNTHSDIDLILKDSKKIQENISNEKTYESNRRKDSTLLINEQLSNKFEKPRE